MTRETRPIRVFRDPDGKPTCSSSAGDADCLMLGSRKFGTVMVCMTTGRDLDRTPQPLGYLRPVDNCPLWVSAPEGE